MRRFNNFHRKAIPATVLLCLIIGATIFGASARKAALEAAQTGRSKNPRPVHSEKYLTTGSEKPPNGACFQGPEAYNVQWNVPGPGSSASMPLGNGDIGLNVWTESNGDLAFYVSKTDAWGGEIHKDMDPWMQQGGVLMKLGLVHVSLSPNPFTVGASFLQTLRLHEGEILVREGEGAGAVQWRIWVDANHPVIRVETVSRHPVSVKVRLDDWRLGQGDTILADQSNRITWFHHNPPAGDSLLADFHLAGIQFGAIIQGKGLVRKDLETLENSRPVMGQVVSIYPLTETPYATSQVISPANQTTSPNYQTISLIRQASAPSSAHWLEHLNRQTASIDRLDLEATRKAHRAWWNQFWGRSWVHVHGGPVADSLTQGYVLQRFVTACAGRGAYPVKFNGSIFTVDNPDWKSGGVSTSMNADFRAWGGQYWFQNTRAMYWPRLMAGDFDIMLPLFRMYADMLPENEAQVKKYYNHEGAYFMETSPFWGGLPFMGPEVQALYTHHYFTPILELSMMMLDYYEYTGDERFARKTLLPLATAGLRFFDEHFPRDASGKLLLDPDNAIEMFWKVHDPAPDIAALHAVLKRMIGLPAGLADSSTREGWKKLYRELPDLPVDTTNGAGLLLPYTGPQTAQSHNSENPELYAIYPYRIYGLGKPDLALAIHTFNTRKNRERGCWNQDPIQAAMLGLTGIARDYVSFNLTRRDPVLKFPAFWPSAHDYMPDEDNGGNGENGLQQMLMQTDGKKIRMLPAWPSDWDAEFKLHAPYNTTVEGRVVKGKLAGLVVTPASRMADVINMSDQHPGFAQVRHSPHSRFESYKGLVMAGYQGWFNAEGDGANRGWNHYHARGPFEDGNCKFDLWPDVSEYPKTYPTSFTFGDGSKAYLFSSYDASTTDLHFKWMQAYGIDGVFVQRFVSNLKSPVSLHANNTVLEHALEASRTYNRAIAVMYDMSGMNDSTDADLVIADWKNLVDSMGLTSGGNHQTYLYHRDKPLVALWGAGFNDHRAYTAASVQKIMQFLQHDPVYGGCSILLGIPTYWRDQGNDADKDPRWMDLYKQADILQPWTVGRYNENTYLPFKDRVAEDIRWCKAHGIDYVPVVFPGFSWHNMYNASVQNQIPRDRGRFFWKQIAGDIAAGSQMLYVAMFDEIDEGTAIFKISLAPPSGKSTFVSFDPGIPSDYYLDLAGYAAKMLRHQVPFTEQAPAAATFKKN